MACVPRSRLVLGLCATTIVGCSGLIGLDKDFAEVDCFPIDGCADEASDSLGEIGPTDSRVTDDFSQDPQDEWMGDAAQADSVSDAPASDGDDVDAGSDAAHCLSNEQDCSGTCVDLQMSQANCGSCGHSCLGGACTAGLCQPVTIASGQPNPLAIAVDPTTVFWTDGAEVRSCSLPDCTAVGFLAVNQTSVGIAIDSQNVYWANAGSQNPPTGSVVRCGVQGCAGTPSVIASGQVYPWGIAVDSTNVYWTNQVANGTVMTCPIAACDTSGPKTIASSLNYPTALAVDSHDVYVVTATIQKCPLSGCGGAATTLSPSGTLNDVAVDSSRFYWVDEGTGNRDGSIMSCPLDGCPASADGGLSPSVIASGLSNPSNIATDNSDVYWTVSGMGPGADGTVMKWSKSGTAPPTVFASGQAGPTAIALDSTNVYWLDRGSTSVMRLAK